MLKKVILSGVIAVCLTSNAYAGLKVVIETEKPVSDFVVECQWFSDFLNLHGGKKQVKNKVFVASSGEEIDCGWALYGDASAMIFHPLYMTHYGCTYSKGCDSPYQEVVEGVLHLYPVSIDKQLELFKQELKDEKLRQRLKGFLGAHFHDNYFRYYRKVKKVDMNYFRATYSEDLEKYWIKVREILFGYESFDPAAAVESYWKRNEDK